MRHATAAPLCVVLLLGLQLLAPAPTAAAATPHAVGLHYTVRVDDPASGQVNVTLAITGAQSVIERFTFVTAAHQYPLSNISATGGVLTETSDGHRLTLDEPRTTLSYTVNVERPATREGEYNARLGADWGVFKAEALGIGFNVRHDARYDPVWDASASFVLPAGWNAQAPWRQDGPLAFELPEDAPLPRGFVAVGEFTLDVHRAHGRTFRYVELGEAPPHRADMFPYLERATPYFEAVYGNHTGPVVLVVSAPSPMFRGGLAGHDSLYLHESSDVKVLAHEYAHVWQRFNTVERPGASSLWVVEGDADYHGPLSLVAAELWSPGDADAHFRAERRTAEANGELTQPLTSAVYGGEWEKVAYRKGALVLHQLDQRLNLYTEGRARLVDVLQALNARMSDVNPDHTPGQRVTNAYVRDLAIELAGDAYREELEAFFDDYVFGDAAPAFTTVQHQQNVQFTALNVTPPTGLEGEPSRALVTMRNVGPTQESKTVVLYVNGSAWWSENVTLDRLEERTLDVALPDLPPGDYPIRVAYHSTLYRVLTPPDLRLARVTLLPASPAAGQAMEALATVENRGGAPGAATLRLLVDGAQVAEAEHEAPGGLRESVPVAFTLRAAGAYNLTVELVHGGAVVDTHRAVLTVVVPDTDGDGVADDADAYPEDARFWRETAVTRAVKAVPGPGAPLLALAAVAAARAAARPRE